MAMLEGSRDDFRPVLTDTDREILLRARDDRLRRANHAKLRQMHPPLMEAWEKYQVLLKLYESGLQDNNE